MPIAQQEVSHFSLPMNALANMTRPKPPVFGSHQTFPRYHTFERGRALKELLVEVI